MSVFPRRLATIGCTALLWMGCGDGDTPTEGDEILLRISSGSYEIVSVDGPGPIGFPHEGAVEFDLAIDRETGTAIVTYGLDGQRVTEFWRIAR